MASKLTLLTQQLSAAQMQKMSRESYQWLLKKINELRNPSLIPRTIANERFRQTRRLFKGRLYQFFYDPKGKADMPYYDRFPLVLILEKYDDGFLGLNLHYLPIKYRVAFLDKLLNYAILDDEDNPTRLRITYDILTASRRFKEFRPCIKRYLFSQIRSKILTIEPQEWEVAIFLPTQLFKGAKPQKVWQESVNEIRKS
jgi:hypothetical protein